MSVSHCDENVLNQRSAERDVQNLDAAADREHGNPPSFRFNDEAGFGCIARGVYGAYFFVAPFSVTRRIDVLTASENQAGDGIEHCSRGAIAGERRNDEWYEPCTFEGGHVGGGKANTTGIAIRANASGNSNCAGWNRLARGRHE